MPARRHVLALTAIALVGLLTGMFWVSTTEVYSNLDEAQHLAYIDSLATGHGIPTVGKDKVPGEIIAVARESKTMWYRGEPHGDASDPSWGAYREQYEAVQPPLYYALMVPAYWVGQAGSVITALYVVRVATYLVFLLSIPLLYLLARELFPRHRAAWLLAPGVLVMIQGLNANLAQVTNDALVVPISILTLLTAVRLARTPTPGRAVLFGAACGATILTKATTIGLFPLAALPLAWAAIRHRDALRSWLRSAAISVATGVLVVAPWVLWNGLTYGALTAAEPTAKITGGQGSSEFTLGVLRHHLFIGRTGFWDRQLAGLGVDSYSRLGEVILAAAVIIGVVGAFVRRDTQSARRLLWIGAALPLIFAGMVGLIHTILDGGNPSGRHLYSAVGAVALVIAAGLVVAFGARIATGLVLAILCLLSGREPPMVRHFVDAAYTWGVQSPNLVPVVDVSRDDRHQTTSRIRITPPCATRLVGIRFVGPAPTGVRGEDLRGAPIALRPAGEMDPPYDALFNRGTGKSTLYALERTTSAPFELRFAQRVAVGTMVPPADGRLSFDGTGEPVGQIYCPSRDARAARYDQLFPQFHHLGISYGQQLAWPTWWMWGTRIALIGYVGYSLATRRSRRATPFAIRPAVQRNRGGP